MQKHERGRIKRGDPFKSSNIQKVLSCRSILFQPPEFIPAEAMVTGPACKNCKECQFHMNNTFVGKLFNNYSQARECMMKIKVRLVKT